MKGGGTIRDQIKQEDAATEKLVNKKKEQNNTKRLNSERSVQGRILRRKKSKAGLMLR